MLLFSLTIVGKNTPYNADYFALKQKIEHCKTLSETVQTAQTVFTWAKSILLNHEKESKNHVIKVLSYMHEHLSDETLSLKQIAENHLFMNADYLGKQFSKATNCSFSQYLTQVRMEKAKELFDEGEQLICVVAQKTGYGNNPQYFSKLFFKYTNVSAKEYIRQCHKL